MFKKFLFFVAGAALLFSCSQKQADNQATAINQAPKIDTLTIAGFNQSPEKLVNKEVCVVGTVFHVCKHGGKRMFIKGETPDQELKVTVGDETTSFDPKMEGSDLIITGLVEQLKIDEKYLNDWEAELQAVDGKPQGEHTDKGGVADQGDHKADLEQITNYRNELKQTGKPYLAFYSLKCSKFEEKKE